jgi:hypothetical protein
MNYSVSYVFNRGEKRSFSSLLAWSLSTSLRKLITKNKFGFDHEESAILKVALLKVFSVCSLFSWRCRIAFARLLLIILPCKIDSKESENSP